MDWTKLFTTTMDYLKAQAPINGILLGITVGCIIAYNYMTNPIFIIVAIIFGCVFVVNFLYSNFPKFYKWYKIWNFSRRCKTKKWRKRWWNTLTDDEKDILIYIVQNHGTAELLYARMSVQRLAKLGYISQSPLPLMLGYDAVTHNNGFTATYISQAFVEDMVNENFEPHNVEPIQ